METAQRGPVVYPVSHSQVDISTEPKQPCHRPGLTCRAGTVKGGCALLLPDDPPAIQELMNDLYGFALLQGYFIVHCSSVGSDGDVGLSWSTAGEGARYESLPSMRFANSPVLSGPGASSSWSFLVSFCRLLRAICGAPWSSALYPLNSGQYSHSQPPPFTPGVRNSHDCRGLVRHLSRGVVGWEV